MERKSSSQSGAFYVYSPIVPAECPDSEFEIFHHQILKKLPQIDELVRFLKCVRNLGFLRE